METNSTTLKKLILSNLILLPIYSLRENVENLKPLQRSVHKSLTKSWVIHKFNKLRENLSIFKNFFDSLFPWRSTLAVVMVTFLHSRYDTIKYFIDFPQVIEGETTSQKRVTRD